MNTKLKAAIAAVAATVATALYGEEPAGYYNTCEGLKGAALLSELCDVVGPHTTVSYDGLWDIYPETDADEQGKMWDMYSTKRWTFSKSNQCGNYKNVGDCYNREHSMPKSWFNDAKPMYSDAFHLYPTDGKVNGQRSNYPYGECAGGTTLPSNGGVQALGRLGASTFPGYSGTVFEPDDEYKGDFARSYFYMAAAYNDRIRTWDSPMLGGTAYPAYSDWAVELLLKWHRQDPVSKKETDRNEAVYRHQHNRNPFIDHPEMAEHIWGDKKGSGWSMNESADPAIVVPTEGTQLDFGTMAAGIARSMSVTVRGVNITGNTAVSCSGAGFSVSPSTLTAQAVNNGATVTIKALSSSAGTLSGTLYIKNGTLERRVSLYATVMKGLPALEASHVTENSFVANWINVDGDDGGVTYTLDVRRGDASLAGYPVAVPAEDESYHVTGLESGTTYTYTLKSATMTSNTVSVTTAEPGPSIEIYTDGPLSLEAEPGRPSEALEVSVEAENISDDIRVAVDEPFQVSTDRSNWSLSTTLSPGEDFFYIRLYGEDAGYYTTTLRLSAGTYLYDDVAVQGRIRSLDDVYETFESENWVNSYANGVYEGVSGNWQLTNCGVYESDSKYACEGDGCARYGKNATSSIAMAFDHEAGIGTVSFMGRPWTDDAEAVIDIQYSTDGGGCWATAASVTLSRGSDWSEYSAEVNAEGRGRIRLQQTAGQRVLIDNVRVVSYVLDGVQSVQTGRVRSWDAYCRGHELTIESSGAQAFTVYSIDAVARYAATVEGTATVQLPVGMYIVVCGDTSKRIIVK